MHTETLDRWRHTHAFGAGERRDGERRTLWVVGLTLAMMLAEIAAGTWFGSMALLADGWHMGTHAAALSVTVFAYWYARRHGHDPRYSFGTGKMGALGGFASAVGLAVVALLVFSESTWRLAMPVSIRFPEAMAVAGLGLIVNLACAVMLHEPHPHHEHDHDHAHGVGEHHDHNLRGAYLHVLADALTSVLALVALGVGWGLGWTWMDPVMGIAGSLVIARWSYGLLRDTSAVLLDAEVDPARRAAIAAAIEGGGDDRVADLHVWRVGPRHLAAIVAVVSHEPREPDHYKARLADRPDLAHVTVEVHRCPGATHPQPA